MSKKETTALATQENVNMTTVSCSFFKDLSADSEKYVPSVDDCNAMTATELHKNLTAALVGTIVCYAAAKNLVVSAKMRMQAGETVGGCLTFTGVGGYVDLYVRKPSQSLDAAVRASYRLLGGLAGCGKIVVERAISAFVCHFVASSGDVSRCWRPTCTFQGHA